MGKLFSLRHYFVIVVGIHRIIIFLIMMVMVYLFLLLRVKLCIMFLVHWSVL